MSWQRLLYSAVWYLLVPILLLRLLIKGGANPAYRQRWGERFGWVSPVPDEGSQVICLHAVSVGEVMAARPLIEALLAELPDHCVWLTTTTPTGSDRVRRLFGGSVKHSYLPYDLPDAVARFLSRTKPAVFLVMETELWLNLYAACYRRGVPLLLLNARLSARSVRRYAKFASLPEEILSYVTRIIARSEQDAARFQQLGAEAARIEVSGNIKFDLTFDEALVAQGQAIRQQLGNRPVWCAGSTHQGEEEILLAVHAGLLQQFPDLLLILVPRHPERFAAVAELCGQSGLAYARRSTQQLPDSQHQVFLGDSMGELLLWYAASDIAFIGGSLVPVGGHNPLEALAFGIPVVSGQYVENFPDLFPPLVAMRSAGLVESAAELQDHIQHWLVNANDRLSSGQAGLQFLRENKGVVGRLVAVIKDKLPAADKGQQNPPNGKLN